MFANQWVGTFLVSLTAVITLAADIASADIIPGGDTTIGLQSGTTYVGSSSGGTLDIGAGSSLKNYNGYMGYGSGATGTTTISGTGSLWTVDNLFHVGESGAGILRVESGGQLDSGYGHLGYNINSTATVTINGTGSQWTNGSSVFLGYNGQAALSIEAGGQFKSSDGYIGFNSGSSGSVTVSGSGSTWTSTGAVLVGDYGSGRLTVTDGASVTARGLYASLTDLFGNGTIAIKGDAVLDTDLVFDLSHGLSQTLPFGTGGSLSLNASSALGLGAGYKGAGTLRIADGMAISSYFGYLGYHQGSTGTASVVGAGSKWTAGTELYVGYRGSGTLTVSDGGAVATSTLYASLKDLQGNGTITANGAVLDGDLIFDSTHGPNPALSFGTGGSLVLSIASSSVLGAGYRGNGSLRIADGVTVTSSVGYLGYNTGATGTATVSGSGSAWTLGQALYIGSSGEGTLRIEAGGRVSNSSAYIGLGANSNGMVIVDGPGSTWTNSADLYVGDKGKGSLTVTNGGSVSTKTLYASVGDLSGNGTITASSVVLDGDLVFDSAHSANPTVAFGSGGTLNVPVTTTSTLGAGYKGTGSLRIVDGVTVASKQGYLGYRAGSSGTATVIGPTSSWSNTGSLYVGHSGTGSFIVQAGAQVANSSAYIANNAGSTGSAQVSGASKWTNSSTLYVGYSGDGSLLVDSGGQVSSYAGYVGYSAGSTGTTTVSGTASKWTNTSDLYVGYNGRGTLTVSDGGTVTAKTLYASSSDLLGNGTISINGAILDGNLVFDSTHGTSQSFPFGSGGTVNLTTSTSAGLGAGYKGPGTLRVADAIQVRSFYGYLGYFAGASGWATVQGTGSEWSVGQQLYIGQYGNGSLAIQGGGTVSSTRAYLGSQLGSVGTATVSGAGSTWNNSYDFVVGDSGNGSLIIDSGGQVSVSTSNSYVGNKSGSSGTVTVTGTGSKWASRSLSIGAGSAGSLTIDGGGQVTAVNVYVGDGTGSIGSATIHGPDSVLSISGGSLWVGNFGVGVLNIDGGGRVSSNDANIATANNSVGRATISGSGTIWNIGAQLNVGGGGRADLTIENGAQANSTSAAIASGSQGVGNVIVAGAGSSWNNASSLTISRYGRGTLTVSDGGVVTTKTLYASPADLLGNGTIAITGAVMDLDLVFDSAHPTNQSLPFGAGGKLNLNVANDAALGAGYKGAGSLRIASGLSVTSGEGYLGCESGSTGTATVTGQDSRWTSSSLYVGNSGTGSLLIEAGGQVSTASSYVGRYAGSTGATIVSGSGSLWTNGGDLVVGYYGRGTLAVTDGGRIATQTLYAGLADLSGNGTIDAGGLVLDGDLVFDSTHGTTQAIPFGSGGTLNLALSATSTLGVGHKGTGNLRIADGVMVASALGYLGDQSGSNGTAIVSGPGSTWNVGGELAVGYSNGTGVLRVESGGQVTSGTGSIGNGTFGSGTVVVMGPGSRWALSSQLDVGDTGKGTLLIQDGGQVSGTSGRIGTFSFASGTATVRGPGSRWACSSSLQVGSDYKGFLNLEAGGLVSNTYGYIGFDSTATGTATVTGPGSKWASSNDLYVGYNGRGTLIVADGGTVTARALTVNNNKSAVLVHVSNNNMLSVGTAATRGAVTNNGTVSFYADALLAPGIYTPITEFASRPITWSGTGAYTGIGGVWDNTAKTFTVSDPMALTAGIPQSAVSGQRLLVTDSLTGLRVGASFGSLATPVDFAAAPMSPSELASLLAILGPDRQVLDSWNFNTTFTTGEAILTFDLGPLTPEAADNLAVWHFDSGVWSSYTPSLLDCDASGHASFNVTSFSGYAVSVPEPAAMPLVLLAAALLTRRRRAVRLATLRSAV